MDKNIFINFCYSISNFNYINIIHIAHHNTIFLIYLRMRDSKVTSVCYIFL